MAAVAALRACLILVEQRETRYRVQWWYKLFEQTMRGVQVCPWMRAADQDLEANVHASLLTLGELLQHSREFMLARCVPRSWEVRLSGGECRPLVWAVQVCPWMRAADQDLEANVHASLLTLGELLQHSREFMLARCTLQVHPKHGRQTRWVLEV
jgi:hypothetical protein